MSTTSAAETTGVHPSAVGSGTQPRTTSVDSAGATDGHESTIDAGTADDTPQDSTTLNTSPNDVYPEQRHAGAIGYGPDYGKGAGLGDKITGLKEQLKGKITHNPELVQRGKERKTGELVRKEQEAEEEDPFATAEDKESKKDQKEESPAKAEKEQAATVAPEGTDGAEDQRKGLAQSTKDI